MVYTLVIFLKILSKNFVSYFVLLYNLQFSDIPESNFNEQMTTLYMLGVIQILQNTPPVEFKNAFANRWEEIKQITLANLALNRK